jgi:tripartite-type tricarboxylate transporter receptor subunit TctC
VQHESAVWRGRRRALLTLAASACGTAAIAQGAFPTRTLLLVVPFAPGGIADLTARTVAESMSKSLGQVVNVDNRPSAASIVGSAAVAQAAPDGHTLLLMSNANAISPSLFRKLPFDAQRDFAPIGTIGFFDLGLFVAADSRFGTLAELLRHARAQPGRLTIGTISVGSTQHLAAELFKSHAGIEALVVPYKGTPAVLTALRSGEVDLAFEIVGPMQAQVAGRALRVLAVTGEQRHAAWPDVPTVQQSGLAGYSVTSWNALAAPMGTPAAVIERLQRALREALEAAPVRRRLLELGVRPQSGTPAMLAKLLADETHRWGEVVRAAKIKPQ